jgi:hypothetical protein
MNDNKHFLTLINTKIFYPTHKRIQFHESNWWPHCEVTPLKPTILRHISTVILNIWHKVCLLLLHSFTCKILKIPQNVFLGNGLGKLCLLTSVWQIFGSLALLLCHPWEFAYMEFFPVAGCMTCSVVKCHWKKSFHAILF